MLTPRDAEDWLRLQALAGELPEPGCLVLDCRGAGVSERLSASLAQLLVGWTQPVIALTAQPLPRVLARAVDCVLEDERALRAIEDNVRHAPIAAMSLVRLARAIEQLDVDAGLDMESVTYGCLQDGPEYKRWLAAHKPEPMPALADGPPLRLEREGAMLRVSLNRPELRNSMTVEMRDALVEVFSMALLDDSIVKVILTGEGKCFSVGGELREFGQVADAATGHWIRALRLPGRWLARLGDRAEVRVHGACIGAGVELPAFAARVTAVKNSYFQLPELQFGLVPGAGGCVSIARRIGRHRFNYMALSGKRITCQTALDWGLVDEVLT
ncbi:enoyl-CoA hydratase/isomerase family protein [Litorivivens sp.]|uniref:enoyl-CoA hydratase/isomerase family protein n=1 Tax=Litorivivens sp. TaxID=2020868 RepID=UPI003567A016